MKTVDRVEKAFPGSPVPMVVVVKGDDLNTTQVQEALWAMREQALATGKIALPVDLTMNTVEHDRAHHDADRVDRQPQPDRLRRARRSCGSKIIPATIGEVPGVEVAVGGETAGNRDFNDLMRTHLPLVFAFVLGLAFLLLLMTFRSIVIPIKAIILNLLSVGAAYGLLVLTFQGHWAEGILDFKSNGGIASWLPLFLFVLLFGLSMDYHVFIVSRIKELVDRGMPTEEAVQRGIVTTAGTVTSAAIVMVAVFAIFGTLRQIDLKQMGFGLAVAILLDATIVRAVLLPSTMKLLGKWNWYFPTLARVAPEPLGRGAGRRRGRHPRRSADRASRGVRHRTGGLEIPPRLTYKACGEGFTERSSLRPGRASGSGGAACRASPKTGHACRFRRRARGGHCARSRKAFGYRARPARSSA